MATQSQQSLAHKKWYRSLRFKCNGLLHLKFKSWTPWERSLRFKYSATVATGVELYLNRDWKEPGGLDRNSAFMDRWRLNQPGGNMRWNIIVECIGEDGKCRPDVARALNNLENFACPVNADRLSNRLQICDVVRN
jgi:hypothetical protein